MLRSLGPLAPLPSPDLTWDPLSALPRSANFEDGYFGSADALGECQHVFIEGSDLQHRLADLHTARMTIAELGFGTGVNFLATWEAFETWAAPAARLHYISVERHPLRIADASRALAPFAEHFSPNSEALIACLPPPLEGIHRRLLAGGRVILDLYFAEAHTALADLASWEEPRVDSWYLDGFAPARNPEMWSDELFDLMARCSTQRARIASYSCAGHVRRGLERAGFAVQRRPGFGRKRECLSGHLEASPAIPPPRLTPWDLDAKPRVDASQAIVLGAGLAGAHTAAALARRGVEVTVVDAGGIAGEASGNDQGLLFSRLSHVRSSLADFSLSALFYAAHLYGDMLREDRLKAGQDGALDGCFQTPPPRGDFAAVLACLEQLPELGEAMDATPATTRLGVAPSRDGLWLKPSGWLSPPAVCRALLESDTRIRVHEHTGPVTLQRDSRGRWAALDRSGRALARAPVAVACTGSMGRSLDVLGDLPLKVARGQTTLIPQPPGARLEYAFCHRGYLAPAVEGSHCIGATFYPGDSGCDLRSEDHRQNLEELAQAIPEWRPFLESLIPEELEGRAALRCVSPDYLPLIGPVPDDASLAERFAALQYDARRVLPERGAFVPGLFVHTALGSRGLSYAALGAEHLASLICGEPGPLSRELTRAVAPARFAIRDLSRKAS